MRHRRAFSLVELLVVIGVIAVVMGILLPSLNRARRTARQVKCLSNLRQIGLANQTYLGEYRDWCLPGYWGWSPAGGGWPASPPPPEPPSGPRRWWYNNDFLEHFLGSANPESGRYPDGTLCPEAPLSWDRGNRDGFTLHNSYAMNYSQLPGVTAANAPDYYNGWKRPQVLDPSDKIQFCDATSEGVSIGGTPNGTMRYFDPYNGERHEPPDKTNIVAYRHARGANILFYDAHAQWMPESQLRYDPASPGTKQNRRQWEPKTP